MAPGPSRFGIFDFRPTEELRPAKWGSTVVLRSSNSQRPMSALGQKRTLDMFQCMSALTPKADITDHDQHVRFVPKADIPA
jgi:hypothetical protein